jgi:hypothetical protein
MYRQHNSRLSVAMAPQLAGFPCGDLATRVAAKPLGSRWADASSHARQRQFDYAAGHTRFPLDRRLWGGTLVHGAAGQAGSLEGTPPRYFYAQEAAYAGDDSRPATKKLVQKAT